MMRATAMSPKKSGLLTTEAILTLPFDARFTSARRSVDFFSSGAALGDSLRFASVVCRRLARAATAFFAARLLSFSRALRSACRDALRAAFFAARPAFAAPRCSFVGWVAVAVAVAVRVAVRVAIGIAAGTAVAGGIATGWGFAVALG